MNNFYNLAFGDKNSSTGEINDLIVTNNGDTGKVLATVVAAIFAFSHKYPDSWIYLTGSTKARTRLYRMGINKYFSELESSFYIFGELKERWSAYDKNTVFDGYLIQRKPFK